MWQARFLGSTTLSKTSDANINCASVENALVFIDPKIERAHAPRGPLSNPLRGGRLGKNELFPEPSDEKTFAAFRDTRSPLMLAWDISDLSSLKLFPLSPFKFLSLFTRLRSL